MTHKQFKEIKQALLHDTESIIGIAKQDIENVKVYDGPTAFSRPTIPALSSTRISHAYTYNRHLNNQILAR